MKGERFGDPMFYEILEEMAELHSRKNRDYSPGEEPLRNFYECEQLGVPGWKGVLVRLSDKWSRIKNLANNSEVAQNESLEDSLLDSAVYYVICLVLIDTPVFCGDYEIYGKTRHVEDCLFCPRCEICVQPERENLICRNSGLCIR